MVRGDPVPPPNVICGKAPRSSGNPVMPSALFQPWPTLVLVYGLTYRSTPSVRWLSSRGLRSELGKGAEVLRQSSDADRLVPALAHASVGVRIDVPVDAQRQVVEQPGI